MFRPLIVSLLILLLGILSSSVPADEMESVGTASRPATTRAATSAPQDPDEHVLFDKIKLLRIYRVEEGKLRNSVLADADLWSAGDLRVDGYVCGIVALCDEGVAVDIEGCHPDRIRKNADGTLSLRYFGNVTADEVGIHTPPGLAAGGREAFLTGGYSAFPLIFGNSLSPSDRFDISFEGAGESHTISIRQTGYRPFQTMCVRSGPSRSGVVFRYLGTRLEELRELLPDFETRLRAITQGIHLVESALDEDLVDRVNIIDFENVHNAAVCDDGRDIWFYIDAFRAEPLDELRSMAAHESLHIYVDKHGLARHSEVREFSADLKGYDDFSHERFMVVTAGELSPGKRGPTGKNNPLFAFVNEANFLEGAKGGHPDESVDEFCVSFLHSLIFIERLEQNLGRTLQSLAGESRSLTPPEKSSVLENYLKGIGILLKALSENGTNARGERFLEQTSHKIQRVQENLSTSGLAVVNH